jgi:hypothetical protein
VSNSTASKPKVTPLKNTGMAQGAPLSPILYAFFNSDPVDQPVDTGGDVSAYIDDDFRGRVGASAEDNIKKIQSMGHFCSLSYEYILDSVPSISRALLSSHSSLSQLKVQCLERVNPPLNKRKSRNHHNSRCLPKKGGVHGELTNISESESTVC